MWEGRASLVGPLRRFVWASSLLERASDTNDCGETVLNSKPPEAGSATAQRTIKGFHGDDAGIR